MTLSLPERILKELGIDEPKDIDLQLLCEQCNLELEYSGDMSADAEIMIAQNHFGIITINKSQHPVRQKFSIAHELGHWHLHRKHQQFAACNTLYGSSVSALGDEGRKSKEKQADEFAANLLMPPYMFLPLVRQLPRVEFANIVQLSKTFGTSVSATAIQIAKMGIHPIVIAVYNERGSRIFFTRSCLVSEKLWPATVLSSGMYAFDVVRDHAGKQGPVYAHEWFDNIDSEIEVFEESVFWRGQVMSIIHVDDEQLHSD